MFQRDADLVFSDSGNGPGLGGAAGHRDLQEFGNKGRLQHIAIIGQHGEISTAPGFARPGRQTFIGEGIAQVGDDGGRLEHGLAPVMDGGHLGMGMGIVRIQRAAAIAAADIDDLDLIRRAQFLQQEDEARGA